MSHSIAHLLERVGDLLASQLVGALVQILVSYVGGGN